MTARPSLTLLIPGLNEAAHIGGMLESLARQPFVRALGSGFEAIVVDDGSSDGMSDVARSKAALFERLQVVQLPNNLGKGLALREGVSRSSTDFVAFADGDDTFDLAALEPFYAALHDGADLAIGDRRLPGSTFEIPNKMIKYIHARAFVGECFNTLVRLCTELRVLDTQCGFKMFRREVAQHCFSKIQVGGFIFDVEVLLAAIEAGYRIEPVAVQLKYRTPEPATEVAAMSARTFRSFVKVLWNDRTGHYRAP